MASATSSRRDVGHVTGGDPSTGRLEVAEKNQRVIFVHLSVCSAVKLLRLTRSCWLFAVVIVCWLGAPTAVRAQSGQIIDLTLDTAVNLAMENSYRIQQLKLGVQESKSWLRAEQAGLKSQIYMNVTAPELEALSDHKWNSALRQYEIVRDNSHLWQANIAIRQPVILFGYPTNGYLSLNNQVYRYTQFNDDTDVSYYNRYYVEFEQPFFQPNVLKNNIRQAELRLQDEELDFQKDVVDLIDDVADDYYELFELAYQRRIFTELVENLQKAQAAAQKIAREDTSRSIELSQLQVELGNAREQLSQVQSDYRMAASQVKQRLRLNEEDSLHVVPTTSITPVHVDAQQAIEYGETLRPRLRELEIQREQRRINLENTKGWNSFRVDLQATYGREMRDPNFRQMWEQPTNSYSIRLRAYIPIWDWGRHNAQIEARQVSLRRAELQIEEAQDNIRTETLNAIQNLEEYQRRSLNMQQNLQVARRVVDTNLRRYENGDISVLDLIQSINGQQETAHNFLNAYLGYRQALLTLQENTYYDFENDMPLLERFRVEGYME